jgi:hypothetical protein
MGSATIFEEEKQGFKFSVWMDISNMGQNDSTVDISIESKDKEYGLRVSAANQNDVWLKKFVRAFCDNKDFRDQFLVDKNGFIVYENENNALPKLPTLTAESNNSEIYKLIKKGKKAAFRDFAALKSGRDQYSSVKIDDLTQKCGEQTTQQITKELTDISMQLSAMRWNLRGLPVDMAIHKVKVDKEISKNAHNRK